MLLTFSIIYAGALVWTSALAQHVGNLSSHGVKWVASDRCRLSVSHFSRAFRRTMGAAPHNWFLTHRVEVAKENLRDGRLSLFEVALRCGFTDHSHLTRVFTRIVGISPGAWRRAVLK
jgi:AraC-like DNA-binding protein